MERPGICVHKALELAGHVETVVDDVYGILDFLNRGVEYKSRENVFVKLITP